MPWRDHFKLREFGLEYNRPQDFVTLQHGSPVLYVIWTALWFAYHLIWILLEAYWSTAMSGSPGKWMLLLTNLSYLALSVFAFIDFVVSVFVFCLRTDIIHGELNSLPWYMKVQWISINVCGHAAVQVTVIYWIMLATSTRASTINKHGINMIYVLLLVCFSAKPIKFQHVYQAVLSSVLYVVINLIYFSASGKILYPFLDWTKPGKSAILTIAFLLISTPVSFFLLFGLYKLRVFVYGKLLQIFDCKQSLHEKEKDELEPIKLENGNVCMKSFDDYA